ncbi:hypothetical protein C8035_v009181 [Colletotrichum spinosum]|uniref:Uncharacterized protein n=1 Tax=Colletotrichum spinosum TaxID=1347390 RepID=A0A4R8QA23_9PEZI|nr:hypothetical protein C8035_v009181 [Colletotrichum spinosum]
MPPGRRQLFNHVYIGPFAQQTSRLHDQELLARRNRQRLSLERKSLLVEASLSRTAESACSCYPGTGRHEVDDDSSVETRGRNMDCARGPTPYSIAITGVWGRRLEWVGLAVRTPCSRSSPR